MPLDIRILSLASLSLPLSFAVVVAYGTFYPENGRAGEAGAVGSTTIGNSLASKERRKMQSLSLANFYPWGYVSRLKETTGISSLHINYRRMKSNWRQIHTFYNGLIWFALLLLKFLAVIKSK